MNNSNMVDRALEDEVCQAWHEWNIVYAELYRKSAQEWIEDIATVTGLTKEQVTEWADIFDITPHGFEFDKCCAAAMHGISPENEGTHDYREH